MKNQVVEKNKTEQMEMQNGSGLVIDNTQDKTGKSLDKSALMFGVLYVLTMIFIFLVIYDGFQP